MFQKVLVVALLALASAFADYEYDEYRYDEYPGEHPHGMTWKEREMFIQFYNKRGKDGDLGQAEKTLDSHRSIDDWTKGGGDLELSRTQETITGEHTSGKEGMQKREEDALLKFDINSVKEVENNGPRQKRGVLSGSLRGNSDVNGAGAGHLRALGSTGRRRNRRSWRAGGGGGRLRNRRGGNGTFNRAGRRQGFGTYGGRNGNRRGGRGHRNGGFRRNGGRH